MLKNSTYILLGLSLLAIVFMATGCNDNGSAVVVADSIVTFSNDTVYTIVIAPFNTVLYPGDVVDIEIEDDIVHVVVYRDIDGLILLETEVVAGEVWIIQ